MSSLEKQLRKRIWWSCFMRDRLIALGMRRPTRIKDGDFDVPMLERSDFDPRVLPESTTVIPAECILLRDIPMQKKLVDLCISRARLCICIGRVLEAQYSVFVSGKTYPEDITNFENGHSTVVFQRTLLHMIYFATLSALHRSQAS
ncbi:Cutinase transcription factor 1 beta [Colletotrichum fructicola]|nr:Cutinase transcription factor 1 beta [Colletotrichum fructicola]